MRTAGGSTGLSRMWPRGSSPGDTLVVPGLACMKAIDDFQRMENGQDNQYWATWYDSRWTSGRARVVVALRVVTRKKGRATGIGMESEHSRGSKGCDRKKGRGEWGDGTEADPADDALSGEPFFSTMVLPYWSHLRDTSTRIAFEPELPGNSLPKPAVGN